VFLERSLQTENGARRALSRLGEDVAVRLALAAVLAALWLVPAAVGGPLLDRAVTALQSDPVYVDPQAGSAVSPAEADRLRAEIEAQGDGPIFVAVLSQATLAETSGDADGLLQRLRQLVGRGGVYAIAVGDDVRADSTDLASGEAGRLATEALDANRSDGPAAVLLDLVDRVGAARRGDTGGGGSGVGWWPLPVVAVVALLALLGFRRRRK
jgi:hypothetical protein